MIGFGVLFAAWCVAGAVAAGPGHEDWEEGIRLHLAEHYDDAQEMFERAVGKDPTSANYQLWLGFSIGRRAEGMSGLRRLAAMPLAKRAKRQFELACELDGSNLDALEALHGFHLQAPGIAGGSKAEALNLARRIERLDRARGARALAGYFEKTGDQKSAREQLERARDLDPGEIGHLVGLASFLSRRGLHAESDALFEDSLARAPDDQRVWLAAATAWAHAKRKSLYARARQLAERYLAAPLYEPNAEPKYKVRKLVDRL